KPVQASDVVEVPRDPVVTVVPSQLRRESPMLPGQLLVPMSSTPVSDRLDGSGEPRLHRPAPDDPPSPLRLPPEVKPRRSKVSGSSTPGLGRSKRTTRVLSG